MKKIKDKYDVVIIGSGMAGLASGMMLAMEGKKVCILEKNAQIGGTLQTFKRDGSKFDTGVHYVGGLDEGQPLYPYFKYLKILENVDMKKLDNDAFDVITFDDDDNRYPHAQGHENFIQQLLNYFPEEVAGIRKYIADIQNTCKQFSLYNIYDADTAPNELTFMQAGAYETINSYTTNEKLRNVLAGSNLLYAGEEDKSPFYVHALIINSYIESSYKFTKGGSQISRSLNYSIKEFGGEIVRNAEVKSIDHTNDHVSSVTLADGRQVFGDLFISNVHPTTTIQMMNQGLMRKSYSKRILELDNTTSVFTVYITLNDKSLKYFNHNHYHFEKEVWGHVNYTEKSWGRNFAIFALPDEKNLGYTTVVTLLAYMKMEEMAPWMDSFNTTLAENDRSQSYQEFKQRKAEQLIGFAEKAIPGLRSKIKAYNVSTPLTQRDYINSPGGSLYGINRDHNYPLKSQVNTKTKMKNMFFTGQNIIMHGVLGATVSAVVTCSEILGRSYLVDKIKKSL